jgi:hypothetical protein
MENNNEMEPSCDFLLFCSNGNIIFHKTPYIKRITLITFNLDTGPYPP